jgi:hypothetical protein
MCLETRFKMTRAKLIIAVMLLSSMLIMGQPAANTVKASETYSGAPAVVFVQDKKDKMLINDNFDSDNKFYVRINNGQDKGFYFTVPAAEATK